MIYRLVFFIVSSLILNLNDVQSSTNYLELHGFDCVHRQYTGKDQKVILVEDCPNSAHPYIGKSTCYDIGCNLSKIPHAIDASPGRVDIKYTFANERTEFHGNHVAGLINGLPYKDEKVHFLGGGAPGATIVAYSAYHTIPRNMPVKPSYMPLGMELDAHFGTAALSFEELVEMRKGFLDTDPESMWSIGNRDSKFLEFFSQNRAIAQAPIDDTWLRLFDPILKDPENHKAIINCSFEPIQLWDGKFNVPARILNIIGETLEKRDQIFVLSASNRFGWDMSAAISPPCLQQLSAHPQIGSRMIIAVNAALAKDRLMDKTQIKFTSPHHVTQEVGIHYSSSLPGEKLADYAVTAFGTDVVSAWSSSQNPEELFRAQSGTSQAAPLIAATCALLREKHPDWSSREIVQKIKDSCFSPPTEDLRKFYGNGILNVVNALS